MNNPKWYQMVCAMYLAHWGWVMHICISNQTTIASDNGLSPGQHQAIIRTNSRILFGPLGTNFSEILIKIHTFSFKKMQLKLSSVVWLPWVSLNVLNLEMWDLFNYFEWGNLISTRSLKSLISGLILSLHPANERRRYFVTTSLIGCAHT